MMAVREAMSAEKPWPVSRADRLRSAGVGVVGIGEIVSYFKCSRQGGV